MKKFAIFLISATLLICSVNLNAQTDGCQFRFVLGSPIGTGWAPGTGITVTVDSIEYGFVTLPWGTTSAEDTLQLPSGEVNFLWLSDISFSISRNYFEIYNSLDELIYTSPNTSALPELFFTYQNECPVGIRSYTSDFLLYPNPVSNELRITNYELPFTDVKIFDVLGKMQCFDFAQQPKAENTIVINVSNLPNGIYFVMIKTEKGIVTKKVIKQ